MLLKDKIIVIEAVNCEPVMRLVSKQQYSHAIFASARGNETTLNFPAAIGHIRAIDNIATLLAGRGLSQQDRMIDHHRLEEL